MKSAAVIAAAGLSSRMRECKPLLCLGGTTMIRQVIENFRSVAVEDIVVVTGYRSDLLQRHLADLGVRSVENPCFAETKMWDSLRIGLEALSSGYERVFLTPGDVPLVQTDTLQQMLRCEADIVRPVCGGTLGHPVIVSGSLVPSLLAYEGADGLRGALKTAGCPIVDLEVHDTGMTLDADTPEDLKRIRRQQMRERSRGCLIPDIQIQVAKGSAVLTPETAQFLEMVGHTGSIQNACACMHMSYTKGWKLLNHMEKELGYPVLQRFPGGVSGGGSSLTERGRQLLHAYQQYRDALREVSQTLFAQYFTEELSGGGGAKVHENDLFDPARGTGISRWAAFLPEPDRPASQSGRTDAGGTPEALV